RVEFLAYMAGHILHLLHLDGIAFGLGRGLLAFGRMDRERRELGLLLARERRAYGVVLHEAVDEEIRIAADRGSEVRVEREREAEVSAVLRRVHCLCHGAQRRGLDEVLLGLS